MLPKPSLLPICATANINTSNHSQQSRPKQLSMLERLVLSGNSGLRISSIMKDALFIHLHHLDLSDVDIGKTNFAFSASVK